MAKINPVITWLDGATLKPYGSPGAPERMYFSSSAESYQPILADTDSVPLSFAIANNFVKGESTVQECFDMKNCLLTVKSPAGDLESPIVKEKWIKVKCDSLAEGSYTPLGATAGDLGAYTEDRKEISAGDPLAANTIKGAANDGNEAGTGQYNVCKMSAIMHPPLVTTAPANKNSGKFVLVYTFGDGI